MNSESSCVHAGEYVKSTAFVAPDSYLCDTSSILEHPETPIAL
ncbi:hypothetical protein [Microcoleus sp. bin38.metabat.b11b12b14.051]|nr:hypothetical protein [Microcoleus sp. bin38.metabat.b11b12b14.051]